MQLVIPSLKYKDSFLSAVNEYHNVPTAEPMDIYSLDPILLQKDFTGYLKRLNDESKGKGLPSGFVPQTTYWLVDGDDFIGRVRIRHILTEKLSQVGGHIGYDIRPSKRNQGYGREILSLALPKAKALGITKALVTCDEINYASKKVIEANGGIFENSISLGADKPLTLRYWITIQE